MGSPLSGETGTEVGSRPVLRDPRETFVGRSRVGLLRRLFWGKENDEFMGSTEPVKDRDQTSNDLARTYGRTTRGKRPSLATLNRSSSLNTHNTPMTRNLDLGPGSRYEPQERFYSPNTSGVGVGSGTSPVRFRVLDAARTTDGVGHAVGVDEGAWGSDPERNEKEGGSRD